MYETFDAASSTCYHSCGPRTVECVENFLTVSLPSSIWKVDKFGGVCLLRTLYSCALIGGIAESISNWKHLVHEFFSINLDSSPILISTLGRNGLAEIDDAATKRKRILEIFSSCQIPAPAS